MEIEDKTTRNISIVVSLDEIRELIAYKIRQECRIEVVAANIYFDVEYDDDDWPTVQRATYHHTEVLE